MKDNFLLYTEQREIFEKLSDEQAGKLIKAIFEYVETGAMPELDSLLEIVAIPIRQTLDRNKEKYDRISRINKENASKRWNKKEYEKCDRIEKNATVCDCNDNDSDSDNDSDKEKDTLSIKEKYSTNPDLIFDEELRECFSIYSANCKNLIQLGFEKRNRETLGLLSEVLNEIDHDVGQFKSLCLKANELVTIAEKKIDFKMMLRNYIGILNGKYKKKDICEGLDFG